MTAPTARYELKTPYRAVTSDFISPLMILAMEYGGEIVDTRTGRVVWPEEGE